MYLQPRKGAILFRSHRLYDGIKDTAWIIRQSAKRKAQQPSTSSLQDDRSTLIDASIPRTVACMGHDCHTVLTSCHPTFIGVRVAAPASNVLTLTSHQPT